MKTQMKKKFESEIIKYFNMFNKIIWKPPQSRETAPLSLGEINLRKTTKTLKYINKSDQRTLYCNLISGEPT